MTRLRILDLFSGAGGCAMGYHQAAGELGIEHTITGVDIRPMPRYPFEHVVGDALEYLAVHGQEYDFIHASPPCQAYTIMQYANHMRKDHPDLVDKTRDMLIANGKPWVIENVPGAPMQFPITLCGLSLGLRVIRHRLFDSSEFMLQPPHVTHPQQEKVHGATPDGYLDTLKYIGFTTSSNIPAFRDAMGCEWMTPDEARQAIPPVYTRWIGAQLFPRIVEVQA